MNFIRNKLNINWQETILVLLSSVIILSYLIPLLFSYFISNQLMYTNAWDEYTYLTYQGALGGLSTPGYAFSSIVTLIFQEVGISGSIQNFLLDITLPILTIFILSKILLRFEIKKSQSIYLAIILLFSSVLFNYTNPLFHLILGARDIHFLMVGYESYVSILRTPEPQISYFLSMISICLYIKYKKAIILFIPLLFIYFYVAVIYFFLLMIYFDIILLKKYISFKQLFISSFKAYLVLVFGLILMDTLFLSNSPSILESPLYISTHKIILPVVFLFSATLFSIQLFIHKKHNIINILYLQFTIMLAIIFIANVQVLTGYMLSYKNYYDYGFSILGGGSLVLFLYSLSFVTKKNIQFFSIFFILIALIILNLKSKGFKFSTMQYLIDIQYQVTPDEVKKIKQDSRHALIIPYKLRAYIAYSSAKMIFPPFTYQYKYAFIEKQCIYNNILYDNAMSHPITKNNEKYFTENFAKFNNISYSNALYCNQSLYEEDYFFKIKDNELKRLYLFPAY